MAIKGLFEGQAFIKESLQDQFKAYRNIGIKLCLLLWIGSFSIHFTSSILNVKQINFDLANMVLASIKFSIIFGVIGFCIGAVWGHYMQHRCIKNISEQKKRRKEYIKAQLALREERLGIM